LHNDVIRQHRWLAVVLCALLATMRVWANADSLLTADTTSATSDGADSVRTHHGKTVVVSASRWVERASTVSRQITVVTPQDVRLRNPATAADLLEGTGEVYMQRSQAGGGSPRLRGFAANNVLMVVDGIRLNNLIYRTGNLQNLIQVDASSLAGAEVLFGPGSVQYGSDALGGVMVFRTKDPVFHSVQEGMSVRGEGFLRYGSAAAERTAAAEVDLSWNRVASYTSVTASRFGDLRSGGTFPAAQPTFGRRDWYADRIGGRDTMLPTTDPLVQRSSGYDQVNLLQKLRWQMNDDWTLGLTALFTTTSDIPRYDRLFELRTANGVSNPRFAEWYYGPQMLSLNALTLTGKDIAPFVDDLAVVLSQQWYSESRHNRVFGNDVRSDQFEQVSVTNLNIDARMRIDEGGLDRDLYYGLELSLQSSTSTATDMNIVTMQERPGITRYPDGGSTYRSYAAYVQTRWEFTEALSAAGGLRATLVDLQSTITDASVFKLPFRSLQTSPAAVTGSVGLTWVPSAWLTVRSNLSTGFRAPNVDDIGKVFDSQTGLVIVPNQDLGPMSVTTLEGGIEVTMADGWTFNTTVFRSRLADVMQVMPTTIDGRDSIEFNGVMSQVTSLQNIGTGDLQGVALVLHGEIDRFAIDATASVTTGKDNNGAVLVHITPAFGVVRLSWRPITSLTMSADARWSAAWLEEDIPLTEVRRGVHYPAGGLPAWTVAGLRASYDLSPMVTLQAAIENLFDLQYRPAGSGISAPGRNFVGTLRMRW
jgi:hemoglobin/transferrin/lactoferrin receptor protein